VNPVMTLEMASGHHLGEKGEGQQAGRVEGHLGLEEHSHLMEFHSWSRMRAEVVAGTSNMT
jgi:hypothetical protein